MRGIHGRAGEMERVGSPQLREQDLVLPLPHAGLVPLGEVRERRVDVGHRQGELF